MNEIMNIETNCTITEELDTSNNSSMYCSIKGETVQDKVAIFNAISNPKNNLSDCIGMTIDVKDVVAHYVHVESTINPGEIVSAPRIVLIGADGVTYACVSTGIMQALKQIFMLFGMPTWETPVRVKVVQKTGRKGFRFLSLELVA